MFLVYEKGSQVSATNLNGLTSFSVVGSNIVDYVTSRKLFVCDTKEEALARFNDIIDAAIAGENVYDSRKEVGYWKAKKPGPKPKAKAPAPETPQPKK